MAKQLAEYRFTRFPDDLLDEIKRLKVSGAYKDVLLELIQRTWGWHKPHDRISNHQIAAATGLDRRNVQLILRDLERDQVIKRHAKRGNDVPRFEVVSNPRLWRAERRSNDRGDQPIAAINRSAIKGSPTKEVVDPVSTSSPDPLSVVVVTRELLEAGVTRTAATRLANAYPAERIREKLALLKDASRDFKNPGGFLVKAIEDDYAPPRPRAATDSTDVARPLLEIRTPAAMTPGPHDLPRTDTLPPPAEAAEGDDIWSQARRTLRSEMRPAAYTQWLAPAQLLAIAGDVVTIAVPAARIQRYVELRLQGVIERALKIAAGAPRRLEVLVSGEAHELAPTTAHALADGPPWLCQCGHQAADYPEFHTHLQEVSNG